MLLFLKYCIGLTAQGYVLARKKKWKGLLQTASHGFKV